MGQLLDEDQFALQLGRPLLQLRRTAVTDRAGTPQFKNIIVNGAHAENSVSGAYEKLAGYNSSNLAQIYLGNVELDNNTQSGDEYATVFLDNVNGLSSSGTDVTTSTWTASGGVPGCSAFKF